MDPSSNICQDTFENPWNLLKPDTLHATLHTTLHACNRNKDDILKKSHDLRCIQDTLDEKKQRRKSRE